jgi:hypothetical protein
MPAERPRIAGLPPGPPLLQIVVDTETEFDWSQPFDRSQTPTESLKAQPLAQSLFDEYRLKPAYVVDYPVAMSPEAEVIRGFLESGRCLVGAHLHPWVNPPLLEPVNDFNSYPCNLPPSLERHKLEVLTEAVTAGFGTRPVLYKAGRYGIGPATATTLEALGYLIDLSVVPHSEFCADGGPDFRGYPDRPYWFGTANELLEIPLSRGFWGMAAGPNSWLARAITVPDRRWLRSACSRLWLVQRLALTPEGFDSRSHARLVRGMLRRGHRVFTITYHSPSLVPGHTPYVRSQRDLDLFLDRIKRLLALFFEELGAEPTTPLEVRELALAAEGQASHRAPASLQFAL